MSLHGTVLAADRMRNSKRYLLEIRLSLPFQESDDAFLMYNAFRGLRMRHFPLQMRVLYQIQFKVGVLFGDAQYSLESLSRKQQARRLGKSGFIGYKCGIIVP